ncbi:MAG: glycosyltransferase family 4 protein [Gemmataceae bacterium]
MRVLLNMLVTSGRKTGIGHYVSETFRALGKLATDDQFEAFPKPWVRTCYGWANKLQQVVGQFRNDKSESARPGETPAGSISSTEGSERLLRSRPARLRKWTQSFLEGHLRGLARRNEYSLYHEPNYLPLPSDIPTITTVYDLSVLLHPEWHPVDRVTHFEKNFGRTLNQSRHLLAISETGRQEIIREFGVPPERVSRAYPGVRTGFRKLPKEVVARTLRNLALPPRYLLFVGTIEPRKNVLMLLKAYCSLPAQFRARWPLLLVGGWGWNTNKVRSYFADQARHKGVLHLGYVEEKHLSAVYNGARALVFPSHYEGFGLPPLEMMACGGSVLASTAPTVKEVLGGVGHAIPPDDLDGWRDGLQRIAEDEDWWASLQVGAQHRAQEFTWERCARETHNAYGRTLFGAQKDTQNRAA